MTKTSIFGHFWEILGHYFPGNLGNGKMVATYVVVMCHVETNRRSKQKLDYWPQIPKLDFFGPGGPLEPRWSMFSNQKKCLIDFQNRGTKRSALCSQKNRMSGPKKAFLSKYWPSWPI